MERNDILIFKQVNDKIYSTLLDFYLKHETSEFVYHEKYFSYMHFKHKTEPDVRFKLLYRDENDMQLIQIWAKTSAAVDHFCHEVFGTNPHNDHIENTSDYAFLLGVYSPVDIDAYLAEDSKKPYYLRTYNNCIRLCRKSSPCGGYYMDGISYRSTCSRVSIIQRNWFPWIKIYGIRLTCNVMAGAYMYFCKTHRDEWEVIPV